MKNKLFKILPWLLLIISIILIITLPGKKDLSKNQFLFGGNIANANKITCSYPQVVGAYYIGDSANYSIPEKETNPLIFTFSDFENEVSELSYVDSTQTITTLPILKFVDNNEKLVFIEGTGENYMTVHTIYKNKGISSYTKQVDLLGTPSITMSMGACKISF